MTSPQPDATVPRVLPPLRGGESAPTILVVTGLAREARIAGGPGVTVVCSGSSPARLRDLLAAMPIEGIRAVISFGLAGGLDPALRPGDVVVATEVVADGERYDADPSLVRHLRSRLAGLSSLPVAGPIAGVERAIFTPADKHALRERTGAVAVEMESHVAAAFAAARGLPFAAVRAICDPAERAMPDLVATALRPDGGVDLPAVLRALLRRPADLAALVRLAGDARAAFAALARCRGLLGPGLGLVDFGELGGDVA